MPVRIYDIAKKYGLENKQVLEKAKSLGIQTAKVPSSSLDKVSGEWLEEELLKDFPEIAAKFAPPPILIKISEVAKSLGLPIVELHEILKEFSIHFGYAPDALDKTTVEKISRLANSGEVIEKRLGELEKGNKSLRLRGFPLKQEWINRITPPSPLFSCRVEG